MKQLDLFDQPPKVAKMIAFPPHRMTTTIRIAAARANAAGERSAQVLHHEVGLLLVRYWAIGILGQGGYQLAANYEQAIIAEMHRQRSACLRSDPLGAA